MLSEPLPRYGLPLRDRLAKHIEIGEDDCIVWTGSKQRGYGSIKPPTGRSQRAHRLVWDTVVLAEVAEHLDNPGAALAEAFRVARKRVVVSLPLNGWCDPTHEWRVRMDRVEDPAQREKDPTKGEQIVLTFERGKCWPETYYQTDPEWAALFGAP